MHNMQEIINCKANHKHTISPLGRKNPRTQHEDIDFILLLLDRPARLVDAAKKRHVALHKRHSTLRIHRLEILDNLRCLRLIPSDEIHDRGNGIFHKRARGRFADAACSADCQSQLLALLCYSLNVSR
jgi:hypothetical protein